jgi:hypothetical protein
MIDSLKVKVLYPANRPAETFTGVTNLLDRLGAKQLSLLRELKSPARRQPNPASAGVNCRLA